MQEGENSTDHDDREEEIDQTPVGIDDRVRIESKYHAEIETADKCVGCRGRDRVCAVEIFDDLLDHDGKAKGHKNLVRMRTLIEVLDQTPLHSETDADHDRDGHEDRDRHRPVNDRVTGGLAEEVVKIGHIDLQRVAQKVCPRLVHHLMAQRQQIAHRDSDKRAEHKQCAMGKVNDTKRAEDKRQAERDQRISRAFVQPVENLKNELVHRVTSDQLLGGELRVLFAIPLPACGVN